MNYDRLYYENEDFWNERSLVNTEKDRIEFTYSLIPPDVTSLLDVGCGNGLFLNYIQEKHNDRGIKLCGVDTSGTALKYVKTQRQQADLSTLPFEDGSFDLVSALEVVEHLSVDEYNNGLKEILRVAKKYILVSVPFQQNLEDSMVRCQRCKTQFNIAHHKRTFDAHDIQTLFDSGSAIHQQTYYYGRIEHMLLLTPLYRNLKKIIPPPVKLSTPCPVCGYYIEKQDKSETNKKYNHYRAIHKVASIIRPLWPKSYSSKWVVGLYKRV